MTRFLINSYELICEIALWIFFVGMAFAGYSFGGFGGLLIGLIIAFLFGVFFIAPFAMIEDIRKSVVKIERLALESRTTNVKSNPTQMSPAMRPMNNTAGPASMTPSNARTQESAEHSEHSRQVDTEISAHRGRRIVTLENGFGVEGVAYQSINDAISAIDKMELPADDLVRKDFTIGENVAEVRGHKIVLVKDGYRVRGIDFPSLAGAISYIQKL